MMWAKRVAQEDLEYTADIATMFSFHCRILCQVGLNGSLSTGRERYTTRLEDEVSLVQRANAYEFEFLGLADC